MTSNHTHQAKGNGSHDNKRLDVISQLDSQQGKDCEKGNDKIAAKASKGFTLFELFPAQAECEPWIFPFELRQGIGFAQSFLYFCLQAVKVKIRGYAP